MRLNNEASGQGQTMCIDDLVLQHQPNIKKTKPIRRSKMNRRLLKEINLLYSNIQGFTGKKESIVDIMQRANCDICLLTETMTVNVKLNGMKCITAKKSIGQDVAIVLRGSAAGIVPMKLYEPNEAVNMLGIRLEIAKNNFKRFYTAHLKQMSTNDKEVIVNQFDEIKQQFRQAAISGEGMLLVCDANVHVGGEGIPGCDDKQDWGGSKVLEMIDSEGLYLVNREEICTGVVTRVDPRNGTESTLDLAICNEQMMGDITEMVVDENEDFRPNKYSVKKPTKTDHNTILLKFKVGKIENKKSVPFFNTKCEIGQIRFQENIGLVDLDDLFNDVSKISGDYSRLMDLWNDVLSQSFKKVRRSSNKERGIDRNIKQLMVKEGNIKRDLPDGKDKEEKLSQIRAEIGRRIAENIEKMMEHKVEKISEAKCPQAEVFRIRKNFTRTENLDFPLKDRNGNIRVTKNGIDEVISSHFTEVFNQNPVNDGWHEYWEYVVKIYDVISRKEADNVMEAPKYEEICEIIDKLDSSKSVYGTMSIDLIKKTGCNVRKMIFRCVSLCFKSSEIPDAFRIEKMILLYKHKGKLDELDNYRGIFLRLIILTIYQKWLYTKCAPIADGSGSESAYGGRKGKSTIEPLLIIKLIQDNAKWTKEQIIFKFMDVEKFFDSMNFHRCMIDIYRSGVSGSYWKAYESINKSKTCVPIIPSGPCSKISVHNVFVQGSSDAALMAWNHMDTFNKKEKDLWSKRCIIHGVDLDALTFVDDIFEVMKTQYDLLLSSARSEVFQNETRLNFKPPKCKIMVMYQKEDIADDIGGTKLLLVAEHEYLGTVISDDGSRNKEINRRISDAKSVSNEIVQILKTTELSKVRLRYVNMLSNACLDSKVKYGCAVWNKLNSCQTKNINDLKVRLVKRVLELPFSTPSSAIKYDFGITDLDLDCYMEKIILAYGVLSEESLGSTLLREMMKKNVPGFCVELKEALQIMNLNERSELLLKDGKKIREALKKKIVLIQKERLVEKMMSESKSDGILLNNFKFDGRAKKYLIDLPFEEARVVFMLRSRMFPTKDNFKSRWGTECEFCCSVESDVHLFSCVGYRDLLSEVHYDMFMNLNVSTEELSVGAKKLLKVKERLELFNKSDEKQ